MLQTRISAVLDHKGNVVHTVTHECSVFDAIGTMDRLNIGAVLVTQLDPATSGSPGEEPGGRTIPANAIVGIFTERDYLRKIALKGRSSRTTAIHEVMVSKLIVVRTDATVGQAVATMTRARIRHLPVVDDGVLAGLLSMGDLVKAATREQDAVIEYLQDVLSGKPGQTPRY